LETAAVPLHNIVIADDALMDEAADATEIFGSRRHACTQDGVRGRTVVAIVCNEIGFWAFEEDAANPADEVLAALRPGMASAQCQADQDLDAIHEGRCSLGGVSTAW